MGSGDVVPWYRTVPAGPPCLPLLCFVGTPYLYALQGPQAEPKVGSCSSESTSWASATPGNPVGLEPFPVPGASDRLGNKPVRTRAPAPPAGLQRQIQPVLVTSSVMAPSWGLFGTQATSYGDGTGSRNRHLWPPDVVQQACGEGRATDTSVVPLVLPPLPAVLESPAHAPPH